MSAASANAPSKYNKIELIKEGKEPVELNAGTISVDYYESLYSPIVTANLVFVDAGGNIEDENGTLKPVKEALPLEGNEDLSLKITTKTGELDFTAKSDQFKVNRCPVISRESNRQTVMLDLQGRKEKKNDEVPIFDKFKGKISDTVKKILKEKLELTDDKIEVDPTQNQYDFTGRGRGVLNIIRDLCRKSIPVGGDAGYFFYQTKSAFKYKAIDELIKQEPKTKVFYTGALKSDFETGTEDNDNKIMMEPVFSKDQDVAKALKSGTYRSRNFFFDPYTFVVKEITYDLSKDGVKETLGDPPPFADDVESFTKTNNHILDRGSLEENPSLSINNDPSKWQAISVMRYNLLHSQICSIQIPCNVELEAGDVIEVELETASDNKDLGQFDETQSGKYIILHLCHHFDEKRSITSLTLVRDTYGRRKK
tara:strand:- start:329 stop:1603 length:1275 start_codon:yes stop_codon:yes gene_type:complete